MKKMNRSQSSYRQCKTLITEDDNQNLISKYGSKQYASRNPNAATNSFIETNKQNNSLFQSISQRNFATKVRDEISEFDVEKDEKKLLKERCYRYEEEIKRLHRQLESTNSSVSNLNSSKNFNYTEQFYSSQIEQLKSMVIKRDRQLQFYRQQHSTRTEEVSSISSEFNSKIEKDQKDKNLFVKEINTKQIQINNLQERVKYHKSQIETLKIYLAEKDSIINELQEKIGQVDMKKKKIQSYQVQLKQSNEFLKDLESCTQKLKEETEQKDSIITQKTRDIMQLQQTIESYDDKLRAIEESLLKLSQERKIYKQKNEELERQICDWKQSYDILLKKSESIQQYEYKLKAYMSMVDQLNKSKTELVSSNEKYKIAYTTIEKALSKHQDIQKQLNDIKKDLKDKNDKIQQLLDQQRNRKLVQEYNTRLRKDKDEMFLKIQDKTKQNRTLIILIDQLKSKNKMVEQQLRETVENNGRVKDRSEKLDIVMKQNTQLNEMIIKKVDQIQKLQYRINNLQNKLSNLQNQLSKQKIEIQERQHEIRELTIQNDDIRSRYQAEINVRILTEDKLVRSNQEIMTLKFQVTKQEEEATTMREKIEYMAAKREEQIQQVQTTIQSLGESKKQSDNLLQLSNSKIIELKREVEECKKGLDESYRKQKQHQTSIINYQRELIQLRVSNQKLSQSNRQMAIHAEKITEFSELIRKLQVN